MRYRRSNLFHPALIAAQLDHGLTFILEELVESSANSRKYDIVMRDENSARVHSGIKEVECRHCALKQIHIQMHEGKAAALDRLARHGEEAPVGLGVGGGG